MHETTPDVGEEEIYTARFGGAFSFKGNPDLKGVGKIIVDPSLKKVVFKAHRRALLSNRPMEITFGAADIDNVVVERNSVRFDTLKGRSGRERRPFIFWLNDRAQASAFAATLAWDAPSDSTPPYGKLGRPMRDWQLPAYRSVTSLLIALNLAVYVIMAGFLGTGWLTVSDVAPYIKYGASSGPATTEGEWWRLVASLFMHSGLFHVLFNMCALLGLGDALERRVGRTLFLFLYFATGILGGLTSILVHGGTTWSIGASGAICGLYGVLAARLLREKKLPSPFGLKSLVAGALLFVGYYIFCGVTGLAIDVAAPFGGLLSGLILGYLIRSPLEEDQRAESMKKTFLPCAIAALVLVALEVGAIARFGYDVWPQFLFERTTRDHTLQEKQNLQNYQATLSGTLDAGGNRKVKEAADQLLAFYSQWADTLNHLDAASPLVLARRDELLRTIDQQTTDVRREVARRSEAVGLRELSAAVDEQLKAIASLKDGNQQSTTRWSEAENDLKTLWERIDGFETTTDQTNGTKANLLSRIEEAHRSFPSPAEAPPTQDLVELKGIEEKYHAGLDERVKKMPHEETGEALDQTIAVINQELIPFLRECETRIHRANTPSETARERQAALLTEVGANRERADRLLAQLTERRAARRLVDLTNGFNQDNQNFANRASLVGGDLRKEALERVALIKTEVLPYLAETERKARIEKANAPRLQESYDQLISAIDQKQGKWTTVLHDYEHALSFLASLDEREAQWNGRYVKLTELTKIKGGELAARKYIIGELIPYNESSIEQLDHLNAMNASGLVEELRASAKEKLQKRTAHLRSMAETLSAPKKK